MIINTGMRTDIPAFYSDCLAFCTKNPHPLISHLSELDKYKQFWFVTITPYGKDIEPNVPDKKQVISDFKKLSEHLGKNAVAIRYDPIFINEKITKAFSKIGKENNITIHACCEKEYLKDYGLDITGCMSQEIVEKAIQNKLNAPKNSSKRMQCNCLMGNDVGAYNSCMHLCKYCYANQGLVKENVKKHNPDSPFLIGDLEKEDKITEANQKSWLNSYNQISFV